jgi:hypothetical protein
MKFVDVQNFGNIQPIKHWNPAIESTPHNPYIIGNDKAIVSCYQDGVWIYNVGDPNNISLSGYFDTYPQGGMNVSNWGDNVYEGNWGAYPYLPSGIIIANDMQNGVFVLNPAAAYTNSLVNPVGVTAGEFISLQVFPNPSRGVIKVLQDGGSDARFTLSNALGQTVYECAATGKETMLDLSHFAPGLYLLSANNNRGATQKKLILQGP